VTDSAASRMPKVARLPLWQKAVAAGSAGALATLAMAPWHMWPALWIAFPALYGLLVVTPGWRSAFLIGWSFGFGHFATGFAWITNAFYVDSETFAALAMPAIGGLAAGFALYIGIAAVVCVGMPNRDGSKGPSLDALSVLVFAAVWTVIEWWRGWFLTGFPWNPAGSVWVGVPPVLQGASVIGVYGLSLITVAAAASVALIWRAGDMRRRVTAVALCHMPLAVAAVLGAVRLTGPAPPDVPDITLRLVQPNIAQADKWLPDARARHVYDQVRMSTEDADGITHVLWAETAVPFALNAAPQALNAAAQASPPGGALLTGALRVEAHETGRKVFNSLFAVTRDRAVAATYDKAHLVPFGEYMPLEDMIPIPQLARGGGFASGPGARTIAIGGLPPFSPLICYEVVFASAVTDPGARPAWLFNLTNDAWFGDSSGPYQHLAAAQLRAVEEGLPVVRVANTGISAVIDARGTVVGRIPLLQAGILDHALPGALPPTVFARFGHWPALILAALLILFPPVWRLLTRKVATSSPE
jgi:apolipoprotein N-acyltransferase